MIETGSWYVGITNPFFSKQIKFFADGLNGGLHFLLSNMRIYIHCSWDVCMTHNLLYELTIWLYFKKACAEGVTEIMNAKVREQ